MAKIPEEIEQRIKDELSVLDALEDIGASPRRSGAGWECTSPFRDDRHSGSFKIKERENFAKDFATGEAYSAIDILMQGHGLSYHEALVHGASMLHISIPNVEMVQVAKTCKPITIKPKTQLMVWAPDVIAKPFKQWNDKNQLLVYLRSLPLSETDKARMEKAITNYCVGTYPSGKYDGWTIWWYMDELGYVRSGKMMLYKSDGHRNKDVMPNFNWVHSLMERQGKFNRDTHHVELCFFGQHLMQFFPDAVICLVESEKTALICSAFTDMKKVLWMASGGLSMMNEDKLLHMLKLGRQIELYPDIDGYEKWRTKILVSAKLRPYIDSGRLRVSEKVKALWTEQDGEKADIADIMIRIVTTPKATVGMRVAAQLGAPEKAKDLDEFIKALNLVEI